MIIYQFSAFTFSSFFYLRFRKEKKNGVRLLKYVSLKIFMIKHENRFTLYTEKNYICILSLSFSCKANRKQNLAFSALPSPL